MALTDNLEAYFGFDSASGLLKDWSGNHRDLTNNAGVTTDTGKIGSGQSAKFVASSNQYLSRSSAAWAAPGTGFSVCGWLKVNTIPGVEYELVNVSGNDPLIGWNLHAIPNGGNYKLQGVFSTDGSAVSTTQSSPDIAASTWTFFGLTWSNAAGKTLYVNNASGLNTSQSAVHDSTGSIPFIIGNDGRVAGILALDGWMDGVGFWSRVLSNVEISTTLWNSGAGMDPVSPPSGSNISRRMLGNRAGSRTLRPAFASL